MLHPEVLLLPAMMLADYQLTVIGEVERLKRYAQHYHVQHYELNPIWQKDVARRKRFNPRHTVLTLLPSAALALVVESRILPEPLVEMALGCVLAAYGMILGRHFSNLLLFWHLARRPGEIAGQVTLSHQLVASVSLYGCLQAVTPIVLIALFAASWFAYGAAAGSLATLAVHLLWLLQARRRAASPSRPAPAD